MKSRQNFLLKSFRSPQPQTVSKIQQTISQRKTLLGVWSFLEARDPLSSMRVMSIAVADIIQPSRYALRYDSQSVMRASGESVGCSVFRSLAIAESVLKAKEFGECFVLPLCGQTLIIEVH
jgi:hypothetical protein